MRRLTPSSKFRRRKISRGLCIRSGCWKKASENSRRCFQHILQHRKESNADTQAVRKEVLSHYGKDRQLKCCWRSCEISNVYMLSLDHVADDGFRERAHNRYIVGVRLYRLLRKAKFPSGYQTLCYNHQMLKEFLRRRRNRL